jgi:hypothetical protein
LGLRCCAPFDARTKQNTRSRTQRSARERRKIKKMASTLLDLCLDAASSREGWQVVQSQRDALRALPPDLANQLLQRLLERSTLDDAPQQIERFAECATRVEIKGDALGRKILKPLIAPLASFQCLQELSITHATDLDGDGIAPLTRLAGTLRVLSLRGCSSVGLESDGSSGGGTFQGFLSGLTGLESLDLSSRYRPVPLTSLEAVPSLARLTSLKLAGLPVTDEMARGFERLRELRELDLTGSRLTPGFVEGLLGSLPNLTSLRLAEQEAGVLPLFANLRRLELGMCRLASVVPFGRSGELMRLEELVLSADIDGPAAVALPQVLRASAPHLRKLDLAHSTLATGKPALQLLPELIGATRLSLLDLSGSWGDDSDFDEGGENDPFEPPLPLAALRCTQLEEVALCHWMLPAPALGSFLRGVTSLRRLSVHMGEFDDGHLRALAACPLPLLEELDASFTNLTGEFSSASNPWRQLQGLRALDISVARLTSQRAFELLGDALGGALTSLHIGGNLSIGGVEPAALSALCSRCTALRELSIGDCSRPPHDLEAVLAPLVCLERVSVRWTSHEMLRDAAAFEQLEQLVARLRPCALTAYHPFGGMYEISEPGEMARLVAAVAAVEARAAARAAAAALAEAEAAVQH